VGPWLEVRSAYRNLSSTDYDARIEAIRRLRGLGKETESELIALLHHPDEGVRDFAANPDRSGKAAWALTALAKSKPKWLAANEGQSTGRTYPCLSSLPMSLNSLLTRKSPLGPVL